jgi:hypothetical protein
VGKGGKVVQRNKLGEGFRETKKPLTQSIVLKYRVTLSHKGRGHNYERRAWIED